MAPNALVSGILVCCVLMSPSSGIGAEEALAPGDTPTSGLSQSERVLRLLAEKTAIRDPDLFINLLDGLFLISVTGDRENGVYVVSLKTRTIERLLPGDSVLREYRTVRDPDQTKWMLFETVRFGSNSYDIVVLQRGHGGQWIPNLQSLFTTEWDPESGMCGEPPRREIKRARELSGYRITDLNKDGFDDLVFFVTEEDCITRKKSRIKLEYVYINGTFRSRSLTPRPTRTRANGARAGGRER